MASLFGQWGLWGSSASQAQNAKPYYLTERVLACVYGERPALGGAANRRRACAWRSRRSSAHAAAAPAARCPPADGEFLPNPSFTEEDRESWNKSYRQTFLSDRRGGDGL